MSKRSVWCEFSPEERAIIYERDYRRCIYCGSTNFLGIAHVFVSRAHRGKGCKENGVLLCQTCHYALDQGPDIELRAKIRNRCENYLYSKYGGISLEDLIYSKWK